MDKRKRYPKRNIEPNPKKARSNDGDDTTSDSDSGSDKAGDNKYRRNQLTTRSKRNSNNKSLTIQSGEDDSEDDDGSESDYKPVVNISKNHKNLHVS